MIGVASVPFLENDETTLRKQFIAACFESELRQVEMLLGQHRGLACVARRDGTYPIHIACIRKDPVLLKILLQAGADRNVKHAPSGASPLILAAQEGSEDCVKTLLDWGTSPPKLDAQTNQGQTALFVASKLHRPSILSLLLIKGADPEASGARISPLFVAAKRGYVDAVRILLRYGANVNARCTDKKISPLDVAIAHCHVECIVALIEAGGRIFDVKEEPKAPPSSPKEKEDAMMILVTAKKALNGDDKSGSIRVKAEKKGKKKTGRIKKTREEEEQQQEEQGGLPSELLLKSWRIAFMALQKVVDGEEEVSFTASQCETNQTQKTPQ